MPAPDFMENSCDGFICDCVGCGRLMSCYVLRGKPGTGTGAF